MCSARTFVFQADEQCSGQASKHESICGAVLADRRHVHNRKQLLDVVQQQFVEQAFISLLEGSQVAVPVQVIGHVAHIDERTICLQVSCLVSFTEGCKRSADPADVTTAGSRYLLDLLRSVLKAKEGLSMTSAAGVAYLDTSY